MAAGELDLDPDHLGDDVHVGPVQIHVRRAHDRAVVLWRLCDSHPAWLGVDIHDARPVCLRLVSCDPERPGDPTSTASAARHRITAWAAVMMSWTVDPWLCLTPGIVLTFDLSTVDGGLQPTGLRLTDNDIISPRKAKVNPPSVRVRVRVRVRVLSLAPARVRLAPAHAHRDGTELAGLHRDARAHVLHHLVRAPELRPDHVS